MRGVVPDDPDRLQSTQDYLAFLHALAMDHSPGSSAGGEERIDIKRMYAHYLGAGEIHLLGSTTNHSVAEEAKHLHGIHGLLVGDCPSGRRVLQLAGGGALWNSPEHL